MNRILVAMLLALPAAAMQTAEASGILGTGTHLSVNAGNGNAYNNHYVVLGASASYDVMDGVSVGLSVEKWIGGNPGITKYSPFAQYVFGMAPVVHPYIGAFYRQSRIDGLPALNSYGGRAGVMLSSGLGSTVSLGIVHESYLSCQTSIYKSCSETYPDIGMSISF